MPHTMHDQEAARAAGPPALSTCQAPVANAATFQHHRMLLYSESLQTCSFFSGVNKS